ncbi:membrane protein insertase YidC [Sphingobacterium sp. UT-1RO-CII-1]|uniref:membrane protein insertase YidC n=1 Tax=Sphingobacterium sp. UT-1RO-CII-1 TaxID=2995225 RepID=UPI00227C6F43|nr:membrane protein insertase YidC [Sphingobacterium sp. UT-1RO-CII-1]MCY4779882.1 membrane protein insertase YidC [Sphingobacterium sp. UT-1RO-CII-1]
MDRNTLIGLVLIFGILAGSFYLMKPTEQELKQEQLLQDSLKRVRAGDISVADTLKANTITTVDTASLSAQPFGMATIGEEQVITLENELIIAKISSKGGRVKSVELKGEENYDGNPLLIFEGENNKFGFVFKANGENINTNELNFTPQGGDISVVENNEQSLTMRLSYSENQYLDYTYTIKGNDYNVGLDVKAVGIHNLMDPKTNTIMLDWQTTLLRKELNAKSEREKSSIFFKEVDGDVDNLSETSDDSEKPKNSLSWIAFKQHFFTSVLRSNQPLTNTELTVTADSDPEVIKHYKALADLEFSAQKDNHYSFSFFFGPNQYKILKAQGNEYQKIIKMGWGPMGWINKFITVPLFDVLEGFNVSYGIIILILTIFLKAVLFPLTYKSYQSMAKMRVLKPQLDEIKEKVGSDNPMLLQQEQMKLYKQVGVNPLGGCLPLLLQMPFTLAFFFFFPNLFELRGESFLWVKDLSTYDAPISFSAIPLIGIDHISLMCVLMTLTTLLTTWYNNSTSGAANNQMKYIGYFMPLIFFFVLNNFPAGLNYYYFLSAVFTFLTQVAIRQFVDDETILAKIEEKKKNPKVQKKSSFQQKMEDMMRQQQANQQNKK